LPRRVNGLAISGWPRRGATSARSARRRPWQPHAVHYTRPDLVADVVEELLLEEREQARQSVARVYAGHPSSAGSFAQAAVAELHCGIRLRR